MFKAIEAGYPTVLVEGTGSMCDTLCGLIRLAKKHNIPPANTSFNHLQQIALHGTLFLPFYFIVHLCNVDDIQLWNIMEKFVKSNVKISIDYVCSLIAVMIYLICY